MRYDLQLYQTVDNRNHMIFYGNPGTGKITVAKLIGEMYHNMGLLSKGHVVVSSRLKLVWKHIGAAEDNTNEPATPDGCTI